VGLAGGGGNSTEWRCFLWSFYCYFLGALYIFGTGQDVGCPYEPLVERPNSELNGGRGPDECVLAMILIGRLQLMTEQTKKKPLTGPETPRRRDLC